MSLSKPLGPPVDAAAPKRERRKEARPGELLDAALDLFVEKGFAATRAEEVAARAGVSKGTLFLYFQSKEELFKAVVRENISGKFDEWNLEFTNFDGSSADMLRYCMNAWWERIGATKASGITKLIIAEANTFPEITDFYRHEVIEPGTQLIRKILKRGVDRGEFAIVDMDYAIYGVVAPMIFLIMSHHSQGACVAAREPLDPARYIRSQVETLLAGLTVRPAATPKGNSP